MEEKILSAGQKAVIDGFLRNYHPADVYDENSCILFDTQTIIMQLNAMCSFNEDELADYLASRGYITHFIEQDAIYGWVLEKNV